MSKIVGILLVDLKKKLEHTTLWSSMVLMECVGDCVTV
jgi:hypothetical protein